MIGAGTMRAERYGRVVGDPREARAARARGPRARPADGDRLRAARPALGRAAVHRGPRPGADRDRGRRRAARDRDPGRGACASDGRSTSPRCSRHLRAERGVRALLCEGGPRLHGAADRGRAGRRAVRHPRAEARRRRRARAASPGSPRASARLELAWLLAEEATGELFARYRVARGLAHSRLGGAPRGQLVGLELGDQAAGGGSALAAAQHPQRDDRRAQQRRGAEAELDAEHALAGPVDVLEVEQQRRLVEGEPDPGAERERERRLDPLATG